MGLDMYLTKKTYIPKGDGETINEEKSDWNGIQFKRINEIKEDVGYWRKANAIHRWFVKNIQGGQDDCKEYVVPKKSMEDLLKLCEMVIKNKKFAHKLLPTESGFFFGDEEYNDYYYEYIENTIEIIKNILAEQGDFYYQSSW